MKHEDLVEHYCSRSWKDNPAERAGGLSVACVFAYINGIDADIRALSFDLDVAPDIVAPVFRRLQNNGLFDGSRNARKDNALLGNVVDPMTTTRAWCNVAGIGAGYVGVY